MTSNLPVPNVYVSVTDQSQLPQGVQGALAVGINIKANKGPINQVELITSPSDLLTIYTFNNTVLPTDDPSYFTALNILQQTSLLYVNRAYSITNPPLFGGLIFKTTGQPIAFNEQLLGEITAITAPSTFTLSGDLISFFPQGDQIAVRGSTGGVNDQVYTIISSTYDNINLVTNVVVSITIPDASPAAFGNIYRNSIVNPNNYAFQSDDLFIITGKDPGAYNSNMSIAMINTVDGTTPVVQLTITNTLTNGIIEQPYLFNTTLGSKAVNGTSLYITDVLFNSNFILATVNKNNLGG